MRRCTPPPPNDNGGSDFGCYLLDASLQIVLFSGIIDPVFSIFCGIASWIFHETTNLKRCGMENQKLPPKHTAPHCCAAALPQPRNIFSKTANTNRTEHRHAEQGAVNNLRAFVPVRLAILSLIIPNPTMTNETWNGASRWPFQGTDVLLWSFPGADASHSPFPASRPPVSDAGASRPPFPDADVLLWSFPGADAPRSPLPDSPPRSPLPDSPPLWGLPDSPPPWGVAWGLPGDHPDFVTGENGHPALSAEALDNSLVALFYKIVRGLETDSLSALIDSVLEDARVSSDVEMVKNLFVMAFQTRWCRGGKAERLLFYKFIAHLYKSFPEVVLALMHLIPRYGYWKDLLSLLLECPQPTARDDGYDYSGMHARVWSLFADQLGIDLLELETALKEGRTPQISLCAKYAPSEGGGHSKALRADKEICKILFRGAADGCAKYRRMLSRLREQLLITETYMCAQRWSAIDFGRVPSLCMDRHKHAFLNEKLHGDIKHPEDPERLACRERLFEHLVSGAKINGKQISPHELAGQVCCDDDVFYLFFQKQK